MTIKVFSDCHGYLPNISSEFDLLLIAGDITPAKWGFGSKKVQWDWLINEFKDISEICNISLFYSIYSCNICI